jgi:uncharacterized membrane protein HdeD (DUF308 family)
MPSPSPDLSAAVQSAQDNGNWLLAVIVIVTLLFGPPIYLFPTIIALLRRNRIAETFVINLFLGWTLVGWVFSLVMAVSSKTKIVISPVMAPVPAPPVVSPDGRYWWDGITWKLIG